MNPNPDSSRLVVGIDGSAGSREALAWAIDEALARNAPLDLVHAWRPMYHVYADQLGYADAALTAHTHGDSLLAAAHGHVRVAAPSLKTSAHLLKGRPSAVLLEAAVGARMLVVGSRGIGGFHGMQLGSVGLHAVTHAPCSVVVVRGAPASKGPVIVGIDGSSESKSVLSVALEEAALHDSPLLVTWALYVHPAAEGVPNFDQALAGVQADAHTTVQQLLADLSPQHPGVDIRTSFPVGYPAEILANASTTARLLVVGSHGGGGFSGMRLGSISHAVVHAAHCPVMVERETVRRS